MLANKKLFWRLYIFKQSHQKKALEFTKAFKFYIGEDNFNPIIPAIISSKLKILPKFADSANRIMPNIAVPIAPIPTHTAYAVPTGNDFRAMPSNHTLSSIADAVIRVGHSRVKPSVYFKPIAQTTSNSPAVTRITQLISDTLF
jgi:hypothetical protein